MSKAANQKPATAATTPSNAIKHSSWARFIGLSLERIAQERRGVASGLHVRGRLSLLASALCVPDGLFHRGGR
jgi:hypothetical protein